MAWNDFTAALLSTFCFKFRTFSSICAASFWNFSNGALTSCFFGTFLLSSFVNLLYSFFGGAFDNFFNFFEVFFPDLSDFDFKMVADDGFFDLISLVALVAFSGFFGGVPFSPGK